MARRRIVAPEAESFDFALVAGGFLPSLNISDPETDLQPWESPDMYGCSMAIDGRLVKNTTMPSGTAKIQNTTTISTIPYLIEYNRLWNITGLTAASTSNVLYYGPQYIDSIYLQGPGLGKIVFDEDAQAILGVVPMDTNRFFVPKSTAGYMVSNVADTRAFFQKSTPIQEMRCGAIARCVELDSVIYVSNTNGIMAFDGRRVAEVLRPLRSDYSTYQNQTLTVDHEKKRILAGSLFAVDLNFNPPRIFKWSSTSFRFETRKFHLPEYEPFMVDRLIVKFDRSNTSNAWIKTQYRTEDSAYLPEKITPVPHQEEKKTTFAIDVENRQVAATHQWRITDMSSNLYIKEIVADANDEAFDNYKA